MAPKEGETREVVLRYLTQANRPYSANDLHLNLHKEHGKPAIQKAVDALVAEEQLRVKVNGKQTCYFVNQDLLPACSEEELKEVETKTREMEEEARAVKEKVRAAEARLRQLGSSLTLAEAAARLARVAAEAGVLAERLARVEGNTEVLSTADRAAVAHAHGRTVGLWRKRKRMAGDVLDSILESWPKPKKSLLEEIGVDTDEAVGAKLPK